ncbi:type II secretion system protein [Candidatus Saccharibacteria bacterium]|nr:type II secretion system protein [Candidatus Saccharibacteria bacterium]
MAKNIKTKKGFTIIEVVLVLAIAGLIFLMVFVALPQLQSSQRDTQRRQDMSRVVTALVQYQTNNRTKRNNLPGPGVAYYEGNDDTYICTNTAPSATTSSLMTIASTTPAFMLADEGSGATPTASTTSTACNFIKNYMNAAGTENTFDDPDGVPYNMVITENMTSNSFATNSQMNFGEAKLTDVDGAYTITGDKAYDEHVIYVIPGGMCSGESVVKDQLRHFAILYKLEGSGTYCVGSDSN